MTLDTPASSIHAAPWARRASNWPPIISSAAASGSSSATTATRSGEVDVIAFDGTTLVFCEVKTRRTRGPGPEALDAVGPRKRRQVRKLAVGWLSDRADHPFAREIRFDAIGVTFDAAGRLLRLEHLEEAF